MTRLSESVLEVFSDLGSDIRKTSEVFCLCASHVGWNACLGHEDPCLEVAAGSTENLRVHICM